MLGAEEGANVEQTRGGRRFAGALIIAGVAGCVVAATTVALPDAETQSDGGQLVLATGDGVSPRIEIAVVRPDGREFEKVTRHRVFGSNPRWTSDGKRVVLLSFDPITERGGIWVMDADGLRQSRLLGTWRDSELPSASPSARMVAKPDHQAVQRVVR